MKKYFIQILFLYIALLDCNQVFAQAPLIINAEKAGALTKIIKKKKLSQVSSIEVIGKMNNKDFRTLEKMKDLEFLDLSNVSIEKSRLASFVNDFLDTNTTSNYRNRQSSYFHNSVNVQPAEPKLDMTVSRNIIELRIPKECKTCFLNHSDNLNSINLERIYIPAGCDICLNATCHLKKVVITWGLANVISNKKQSLTQREYDTSYFCKKVSKENSGLATWSYLRGKENRIKVDTLVLSTASLLKNESSSYFDPNFILIEDVDKLYLNRWSDYFDIREIDLVDQFLPYAFMNSNITSIKIPKRIKEIPEYCFLGAKNLSDVEWNDSVQNIGKMAFKETGITNIKLPKSVSSISYDAFKDCNIQRCQMQAVTPAKVYQTESNEAWTEQNSWWESVIIEVPKGSYSNYISNGWWKNRILTEVDVSKTWTIDVKRAGTLLSHLNVNGLNSIISLTVTGPLNEKDLACIKEFKRVEYIDLSYATITESKEAWQERKENSKSMNGLARLFSKRLNEKHDNGEISDGEFSLNALIILGLISDPNENRDNYIPDGAFDGMTSLKKIILPLTVQQIGDGAFYGCSSLEEIKLPLKLRTIGRKAFEQCSLLKDIEFPKSLYYIGPYAFENCLSLRKIDLHENKFKTKLNELFTGCKIQELRLPEGLSRIGNALNDCNKGVTIYFPSSLRSLDIPFENCNLYFKTSTPPNLSDRYNIQGNMNQIHIPKGGITAYYARFGDKNTYIEE